MSIDIFSILSGSHSSNTLIPARDPGAATGSSFIQTNMNLYGNVREAHILNEFLHGNIPDFLRDFTPVTAVDGANKITYLVMSDVLSIGTDADYVRMPMNPHTAQAIADKYDCTLPTRKMVNDIWSQSVNKLLPLPWGAPYTIDIMYTHRIGTHSQRIDEQLVGKDPHALTSGHKKDVVLTNRLALNNPGKHVAIYGWMQLNGVPIQGLNPNSHADYYADYSHGIRLISNDVMVNGNPMRMQDVFVDPKLSLLVSDEGPLSFLRY